MSDEAWFYVRYIAYIVGIVLAFPWICKFCAKYMIWVMG